MKMMRTSLAALLGLLLCSFIVSAAEPKWVAFDRNFPQDYIDITSIVSFSNDIVRFWERAGDRPTVIKDGKAKFPTYSLMECNCKQRTSRQLQYEYALEDSVPDNDNQFFLIALSAKADFYNAIANGQTYPTEWESIEPTKHSYLRLDFVCEKIKHN